VVAQIFILGLLVAASDFYFWTFLLFVSFIPHRHFLNSTPQLLARDRRAVAQGAQLGLGDLRTDAAG
jgi:hypothetical protein